jgi:hypothetical protein
MSKHIFSIPLLRVQAARIASRRVFRLTWFVNTVCTCVEFKDPKIVPAANMAGSFGAKIVTPSAWLNIQINVR